MNSVGCNTLPKFFPKFPRIQFINEAKTPGNLLQDAPDFDAIKQEEYENEGMDVIDVNEEDDNRN